MIYLDICKGILKKEVKKNLINDINDKEFNAIIVYRQSHPFIENEKSDYPCRVFNNPLIFNESDFISLEILGVLHV
jgi:hypothetical protein